MDQCLPLNSQNTSTPIVASKLNSLNFLKSNNESLAYSPENSKKNFLNEKLIDNCKNSKNSHLVDYQENKKTDPLEIYDDQCSENKENLNFELIKLNDHHVDNITKSHYNISVKQSKTKSYGDEGKQMAFEKGVENFKLNPTVENKKCNKQLLSNEEILTTPKQRKVRSKKPIKSEIKDEKENNEIRGSKKYFLRERNVNNVSNEMVKKTNINLFKKFQRTQKESCEINCDNIKDFENRDDLKELDRVLLKNEVQIECGTLIKSEVPLVLDNTPEITIKEEKKLNENHKVAGSLVDSEITNTSTIGNSTQENIQLIENLCNEYFNTSLNFSNASLNSVELENFIKVENELTDSLLHIDPTIHSEMPLSFFQNSKKEENSELMENFTDISSIINSKISVNVLENSTQKDYESLQNLEKLKIPTDSELTSNNDKLHASTQESHEPENLPCIALNSVVDSKVPSNSNTLENFIQEIHKSEVDTCKALKPLVSSKVSSDNITKKNFQEKIRTEVSNNVISINKKRKRPVLSDSPEPTQCTFPLIDNLSKNSTVNENEPVKRLSCAASNSSIHLETKLNNIPENFDQRQIKMDKPKIVIHIKKRRKKPVLSDSPAAQLYVFK